MRLISGLLGHSSKTDTSKLQALGWRPEVGLEQMYRRMMATMGS